MATRSSGKRSFSCAECPAKGAFFLVGWKEHDKTLTAIDADSLAVVRTYILGFTPGIADQAPNGELWVTDADNGMVVFFRADADMRLGQVPTGAGAHGIAFGRDGLTTYVSNQTAGTVSAIDVETPFSCARSPSARSRTGSSSVQRSDCHAAAAAVAHCSSRPLCCRWARTSSS